MELDPEKIRAEITLDRECCHFPCTAPNIAIGACLCANILHQKKLDGSKSVPTNPSIFKVYKPPPEDLDWSNKGPNNLTKTNYIEKSRLGRPL